MRHNSGLMVAVLVIAGLQLSACQQRPAKGQIEHPARVERIEGTELSRVTLTEKAIERLGLKTDRVREEKVTRQRVVGGDVVLPAFVDDRSKVWVRVRLSEGDLKRVARGQPARVVTRDLDDDLGDDDDEDDRAAGLTARAVDDDDDPKTPSGALYYVVDSPKHNLVPGERVRVRLALAGSGTKRRAVPYSALIYDRQGQTWVYTSPNPRTFVRHKVEVDYIQGDVAVLNNGPPTGTVVASVGVAELYGTEFKMGK